MRNALRTSVGNLLGREHFGDRAVGARIILKWIVKK
jgi:hypothetical protein